MHHGQTRGERKNTKYVKKHVNVKESVEEICKSREGNNNFPVIGEKCSVFTKYKNRGNSKFLVND